MNKEKTMFRSKEEKMTMIKKEKERMLTNNTHARRKIDSRAIARVRGDQCAPPLTR